MSAELLEYLPRQWVGVVALLAFGVYIFLQVVEKYPLIAKLFPLGTWWHDKQKTKARHVASRVDEAIEDNEVIIELQRQQAAMAATSQAQGEVISSLQETLRAHMAFSVYDSGWHHRHDADNAGINDCRAARHYDFFEFERIWRDDPAAAVRLAEIGPN